MQDKFDPLLLENQLCFPLYAAAKALVRRYEPILKPLDLTYTQYIVMLVMWERKVASVNEIGERVHLDSGTLSPLLNKLISKGFLEKTKGEDSRFRFIALTRSGEELRKKAESIPMQIGCCMDFTQEEAKTLYMLCYKMLNQVS